MIENLRPWEAEVLADAFVRIRERHRDNFEAAILAVAYLQGERERVEAKREPTRW